jgi:hypothetical protein
MNYYDDFVRSGQTFAERIGDPVEVDAALGRIALAYALLQDGVCELIHLLIGADPTSSSIITAELSLRQRLDLFGALARSRIDSIGSQEGTERLGEFLQRCRRAGELRNTYMHSSYAQGTRTKTTARGAQGLRLRTEPVDSALLLDVADFISEAALICQEVPVDLGIADSFIENGETVTYSLGSIVVGTSRRL